MSLRNYFIVAVATFAVLVSCSPEEGSSVSALTVDADNKDAVAKTAIIGAELGLATDSTGGAILPLSAAREVRSLMTRVSQRAVEDWSSDFTTTQCTVSGSVSALADVTGSSISSLDLEYDNCVSGDGTLDGSMVISYSESGAFQAEFAISFIIDGEAGSVSGTMTFDGVDNFDYDLAFGRTINGVEYTVSEVVVGGDFSSGYTLAATISNGDLGNINISASGLISCFDGGFSSGTIEVTDSSNASVMTVVFDTCSSATVIFDGVHTTLTY